MRTTQCSKGCKNVKVWIFRKNVSTNFEKNYSIFFFHTFINWMFSINLNKNLMNSWIVLLENNKLFLYLTVDRSSTNYDSLGYIFIDHTKKIVTTQILFMFHNMYCKTSVVKKNVMDISIVFMVYTNDVVLKYSLRFNVYKI